MEGERQSAGLPRGFRWVSVDDAYPADGQTVLATGMYEDGTRQTEMCTYHEFDGWEIRWLGYIGGAWLVSHWAAAPELTGEDG